MFKVMASFLLSSLSAHVSTQLIILWIITLANFSFTRFFFICSRVETHILHQKMLIPGTHLLERYECWIVSTVWLYTVCFMSAIMKAYQINLDFLRLTMLLLIVWLTYFWIIPSGSGVVVFVPFSLSCRFSSEDQTERWDHAHLHLISRRVRGADCRSFDPFALTHAVPLVLYVPEL